MTLPPECETENDFMDYNNIILKMLRTSTAMASCWPVQVLLKRDSAVDPIG